MEDLIYVIGHKNPDTDSIAAALAYAELKNKLGYRAVPKRLGTLNEETKFATRFFHVESPEIMSDARTQLRDLHLDRPLLISEETSCNEVYRLIAKHQSRTTFVVNQEKQLLGIISVGDLARLKLKSKEEQAALLKHSNIPLLAKDLQASAVFQSKQTNFSGEVYLLDRSNWQEYQAKLAGAICLISDEQLIKHLVNEQAALIVLSAKQPKQSAFTAERTSLISTSLSLMEIIRLISEAFPVKEIMTTDIAAYHLQDYIDDVSVKVTTTRFRSYPVLNAAEEVVAALSRYHLFRPQRKKFILVDHSSKTQSINYIDKAEVVEIVDHHHIGDIQTDKPIYYRNQNYGCTCTIIYEMFKEKGLMPAYSTAGMMLSAIISDTLHFKSETTKANDITSAKELAAYCAVELDEYAKALLQASDNLKDGDVYDLLARDLKNYKFDKYNVAVGQTNYANLEDIQARLAEFKEVMQKEQAAKRYDLIVMMFTHVLAEGTMFLFYGPLSSLMFSVIDRRFDDHSGFDHEIMSRKQQLIPVLSEVIKNR